MHRKIIFIQLLIIEQLLISTLQLLYSSYSLQLIVASFYSFLTVFITPYIFLQFIVTSYHENKTYPYYVYAADCGKIKIYKASNFVFKFVFG